MLAAFQSCWVGWRCYSFGQLAVRLPGRYWDSDFVLLDFYKANPLKDLVVLVHGLGGTRFDMWPISRRLKQLSFGIRNWGYRSLGNRIETHAARLGNELRRLENELDVCRFHLVTHSMGGIIARTMLCDFELNRLGRVVMLAPPHHGSHAARRLSPFAGWLTPSLQQLSDARGSFVNQLPNSMLKCGIEFGIIEASKDRVIAPGTVKLDGLKDFATVTGHHGILTWYRKTSELVERFLLTGTFSEHPARMS